MPRLLLTASLLLAMLTPRDGLAQDAPPGPGRKLLAADSSKKTIALIDKDGKALWRHEIGPLHDLQMLANGNVLFQLDWTHIVEVDPKTDEIVWQYESKPVEGVDRIEVHSFQRLADGNTMIAESGNTRIIEVDKAGKIVKTVPLKVAHRDAHRDTRLVRKLDGKHGSGHYLVAHEGDGICREYDADGKVVWEYEVPLFGQKPAGGHGPEAFGNQLFCALRLDSGNTLIATGNGHRVIEVTPDKKIVWMLTADDLPGIELAWITTLLATGNGHRVIEVTPDKKIVWMLTADDLPGIELAWITTLQVMADGDIVLGNCHAGPHNPQLIQVNRDKKIVWTFQDFDRFGDALANSHVVK